MKPILDTLKTALYDMFGIDKDKVKEEASFESLGMDSLDRVELLVRMEQDFGAEISDEDAQTLKTVGDAVRFISKRLKEING